VPFADEAAGFFFFFLVVDWLEVLWPEAADGTREVEATRTAASVTAPAKRPSMEREVGEFCTLIYPI
jgi:hypothetical protein